MEHSRPNLGRVNRFDHSKQRIARLHLVEICRSLAEPLDAEKDELQRGLSSQFRERTFQGVRSQQIVVVEMRDHLATGRLNPLISRDRLSARPLVSKNANAPSKPKCQPISIHRGLRAIIHNDDFPIRIRLLANAFDRLLQQGRAVVRRDDDGDLHRGTSDQTPQSDVPSLVVTTARINRKCCNGKGETARRYHRMYPPARRIVPPASRSVVCRL